MSKRLDEIEATPDVARFERWLDDADLIAHAPADLRHLLAIARAAERLVEAEADPEGNIDAATSAFLALRAALEAKEDVR